MDRGTRLALLCLAAFLVLFPLVAGKPGLPPTLKADEPAYYLMAMSLARDGDLRCDRGDLERLQSEYPYLPTENLILMTRDGWRTTYFGKPYPYALAAAPFAALAGANGLVAFNMALFVAMVSLGAAYLAHFNPAPVAALFSAAFFFLSSAFAYVFWLQPEVFNMAAIAASLYLVLRPEAPALGAARASTAPSAGRLERVLARPGIAAGLSGAALALAAYNKPVFAAMAAAPAWTFLAARRWRQAAAWAAGFALAGLLLAAGSLALTGQPSAYLGAQRAGLSVFDAAKPPFVPEPLPAGVEPAQTNSWDWIFRPPQIGPRALAREAGYFLWGRHTGLVLYMPFALVAVALFLLHGRRSGPRWATLAALAAVALFFLLWIPFNWYGGGGFIGNRYFVSVYPAFLLLVTRVAPLAALPAGCAWAGLFLGTILFTPFGAPVPEPTLQAHVRNPPFTAFPLEVSMLRQLPGYQGTTQLGVRFLGRKDVFQRHGDELWLEGGRPVEVWVRSPVALENAVFAVRSESPANRVRVELGGERRTLDFTAAGGRVAFIGLPPGPPHAVLYDHESRRHESYYRLVVSAQQGRIPAEQVERLDGQRFYLGAAIVYLGPTDPRTRDVYRLSWGPCRAPATVAAASNFTAFATLTNRSGEAWPVEGPAAVHLSYRWLNPQGAIVAAEGLRTPLPRIVAPGETIELPVAVQAPPAAGSYLLELDPVFEHIAWFSQRNGGATRRLPVDVGVRAPLRNGG